MPELRLKNQPRLLGTAAISAFCMAFAVNASDTASFNCAEAENFNEKIVCTTPHLAELDKRMASAYAIVRAATNNENKLAAAQSAWSIRIRDKCESKACLTQAYNDRINALQWQAAHGFKQESHDAEGRQCKDKKGHRTGPKKDHHGRTSTTATPVGY